MLTKNVLILCGIFSVFPIHVGVFPIMAALYDAGASFPVPPDQRGRDRRNQFSPPMWGCSSVH